MGHAMTGEILCRMVVVCCKIATVRNAYSEYVCGFLVNLEVEVHFVMVIIASKSASVWVRKCSRLPSFKLDGTI